MKSSPGTFGWEPKKSYGVESPVAKKSHWTRWLANPPFEPEKPGTGGGVHYEDPRKWGGGDMSLIRLMVGKARAGPKGGVTPIGFLRITGR